MGYKDNMLVEGRKCAGEPCEFLVDAAPISDLRLTTVAAIVHDEVHHLADGIDDDCLIGGEFGLTLLEKLLDFTPVVHLNDVNAFEVGHVYTLNTVVEVKQKRFRRRERHRGLTHTGLTVDHHLDSRGYDQFIGFLNESHFELFLLIFSLCR
ncbi:hypothetical protein IMSAGC006_02242 [Muribaculaceae bacterium]|nr:hypothetical protein IMSAGC006_02242 [Muribaculaceae bacterium]